MYLKTVSKVLNYTPLAFPISPKIPRFILYSFIAYNGICVKLTHFGNTYAIRHRKELPQHVSRRFSGNKMKGMRPSLETMLRKKAPPFIEA